MFEYAWLMLLFPAMGTLIIALFGTRLGKRVISWLAPGMVLLSFGVAVWMFVTMLGLPAEDRSHEVVLWQWMVAGNFQVNIALLLDQLSITMALIVTGIGFLIHVYSAGYMHDDARFPRFFAYLNFFILMMLTLVLANNYLLLYVGWEGVGLASYLLIGFWFEKPSAADAGKKAFLVNRIGDFGLAIAIMFIWTTLGTLQFSEVFATAPQAWAGTAIATTVTLLLLLAATGKSAQIPLYVWLPDAMEGPTPVSALIHAATMVTAGVYMLARSAVLLGLAPTTSTWVAVIGVVTALFAATIALTQTDLKRILAYSTVSQLGFMFLAVGVGAYSAAIFHLLTHAFFKALLFLGSGSVMHALHGELDIRKMGNLRKKLPVTYWTFLIGAAALAGIPLLSGFFSKDEILWSAWLKSPLLWAVGFATASPDGDLLLPGGLRAVLGAGARQEALQPRARVAARHDHPADHPGDRRGAGRLPRRPAPLADRTLAGAGLCGRCEHRRTPRQPDRVGVDGVVGAGRDRRRVFRLSRLRGGYRDPEARPGVAGLVRHAGREQVLRGRSLQQGHRPAAAGSVRLVRRHL